MQKRTNRTMSPFPHDDRHTAHYAYLFSNGKYAFIATLASVIVILGVKFSFDYFFRLPPAPAVTGAYTTAEVILTLDNGLHVPLYLVGDSSKPYISLNADSIITKVNAQRGTYAKGLRVVQVLKGAAPLKTTLPDNSVVYVNAGSILTYAPGFNASKRQVTLSGEAYFEVVPDAKRVFKVHTAGLDITVLGTAFNVSNYADNRKARVSLLSGRLMVNEPKGKPRYLSPGQAAVMDRQNNQLAITGFEPIKVTAWKQSVYIFDSETLEEISRVITRMFGMPVLFDRPAISGKRFSGAITKAQLPLFLDYIQQMGDVKHRYDKKGQLHLY